MIETLRTTLVPFNEAHYRVIFNKDNNQLAQLLNTITAVNWTEFDAAEEALEEL